MPSKPYFGESEAAKQVHWVCSCNNVLPLAFDSCPACGLLPVKCEMCECITSEEECAEVSLLDEKGYVTVEYDRLCDTCVEALKNAFGYEDATSEDAVTDEEDNR